MIIQLHDEFMISQAECFAANDENFRAAHNRMLLCEDAFYSAGGWKAYFAS